MQISLRAGERIYINGAVVRVDRKVVIELLNDVAFLLEAHVLQSEQTTTPLRQLYFVLQAILVDPVNAAEALALFRRVHASTLQSFDNEAVVNGLKAAAALVDRNRIFEALRMIRTLFDIEEEILARGDDESPKAA
ncbi:MAG: flagellar biosynthesis repressor FlbT [Bauldia sp.]|nr:MAG: flagellar biosynthesis repressor FlbT [Bauldia sp.]MBZ0229962.1 flagellar biosynthesis repressor FlbT [Bauldia sp.]